MDILSLLEAPVSYLEQTNYDFSVQDNSGYTVLHYATLKMNFTWLLQALEIPQATKNISVISANNAIPIDLIPKLRKNDNRTQQFIPFGKGGYSILHLMVYMMNHYFNDTHIDKNNKIKEISDSLQYIVSSNPELLAQKDGNGLSVFEYVILFNLFNEISWIEEHLKNICLVPFLTDETLNKLIKEKELSPLIVNKIKALRIENEICSKFLDIKNCSEAIDEESFSKL